MKRECFEMWTVYEKPSDYPDQYVARRFEITAGKAAPTSDVITSLFLEHVRRHMRERGLYRIDRTPQDEPQIVECWL